MNTIKLKIQEINQILEKFDWLDFQIIRSSTFEKEVVVLHGSKDFSYYHNIEITIIGAIFVCFPNSWTCEPSNDATIQFYEKYSSAWKNISNFLNFYPSANIISFSNDEQVNIFCFFDDLHFDCTTVYYYERENLGPNERVADWVTSAKR